MTQNFYILKNYLRPFLKEITYTLISLLIGSLSVLSLGVGIKFIINRGISNQDEMWLIYSLIVILVGVLILSLTTFTRYYFVYSIAEKLTAKLKMDLYAHLIEQNADFFAHHKSGEIISRLTTDMTILQMILATTLPIAVRNVLLLIGGLILIFTTSIKLSLLVFCLLPFLIIPIVLFSRKIKKITRQNQNLIADQNAHMAEVFNAIPLIKSFQNETYEKTLLNRMMHQILNSAYKRIFIRAFMGGIIIFCVVSFIAFILCLGGLDVINGRLSSGDLSAFIFYAFLVAAALGALSDVSGDLSRASGAIERIFEFFALDQKENYVQNSIIQKHQEACILSLKNVSFRYLETDDLKTIDHVSFEIKQKEFISIVGPSGAGKTTLFQLIMGLYRYEKGNISLCGHSYKDLSIKDIRSKISYVPQDNFLFSGSVYDNIKYGNPDASEEQIIAAAKMAQADIFIKKLSHGYQTEIGERGIRLSGGQKQRIAIARALLKDAEIILLDEATSALDNENERAFYKALEKIRCHKTILLIAHRLSTAEKADKIMVIKDGKVEAFDSKDKVEKTSELYRTLKLIEKS